MMFSSLFSSFYRKLSLTLLLIFLAVGAFLVYLVLDLTRTYEDEIEQKLHYDLATHVIHDNPLLADGKIDEQALKNTFHSMMILGPSFEFYVLDTQGAILTYSADPNKIKRKTVDLQPINEFLTHKAMLPVTGDDPRSTYRKKIFSAAPIIKNNKLEGYLYIIIGGEIYDDVVQLFQNSHILNIGFWSLTTTLIFSFITILIVFALITRPLRRLLGDIQALRAQGFEKHTVDLSHWNEQSNDDFDRVGATLNHMTQTLKQQYEQVKSTDELRRELISYVSHDLRTPLASLSGYLETWQLKHKQLDEQESERLIEIAQASCIKVNHLVDQLFELAHLDGINVPINLEPASITELAHDVLQKLALQASEKEITLDIEPKDPSLMTMVDVEKIERALTNLIDNAIRHCETGGHVLVNIETTDTGYQVHVIDDGCGIPEQEIAHIFEPHYRASNSAKGTRQHGGLGLAITRRIIELHGSQITVTSEANRASGSNQGSTFSFTLQKYNPTTSGEM